MSPPPISPEIRDSVPPLSAGATGRMRAVPPPRQAPLVAGLVALVLALSAGAVLRVRAATLPAQAGTQAAIPSPGEPAEDAVDPDPAPPSLEEEDDPEPPTLDAQRERLFGRLEQDLGVRGEALD